MARWQAEIRASLLVEEQLPVSERKWYEMVVILPYAASLCFWPLTPWSTNAYIVTDEYDDDSKTQELASDGGSQTAQIDGQ